MRATLFRSADMSLRDAGRTLYGTVIPYDVAVPIVEGSRTYAETFRPGVFARSIRERGSKVRLFAQHDRRQLPIGRASTLREDTAGLYAEFTVARTSAGDDALELVRSGVADGFSIAFRPIRDRWDAGRAQVERIEAALLEVSVVDVPVYQTVAAVRSATVPEIDAARQRVAKLREEESR